MKEQIEERYIRPDVQGGYLYNKQEIDYFRQMQAVDVMQNCMLGDYNKKGNYVLDKGIVDELVKMTKIYQYSFGSTTFCQSAKDVAEFGKIDFAVKMRKNAQTGIVVATLQLLETIDRANGYYQNTNTAPIATYTARESSSYIVDMLKYFNIVSKKDDGLLKQEQSEEDIELIVARKRYQDELRKGLMDKIDAINEDLFKKRLKLLGKSAIGKKILDEFSKEVYKINGWFVKEGMPGYYRYLNQVLDGLLEVHSAEVLQDIALKAGLNKINETVAIAMAHLAKGNQNFEMFDQQDQLKSASVAMAGIKKEELQKEEKPIQAKPIKDKSQQNSAPKEAFGRSQGKKDASESKVDVHKEKPEIKEEVKPEPKPEKSKGEDKAKKLAELLGKKGEEEDAKKAVNKLEEEVAKKVVEEFERN